MAAKGSKKKVAAARGPLGTFRGDETVYSWLRLATEARGATKNKVRLQLSIDLNKLAESREKSLIDSLVNLIDAAYVDATLMLTGAEPGSGHHGGNDTNASGTASNGTTEPEMKTARSSLPVKSSKASKG